MNLSDQPEFSGRPAGNGTFLHNPNNWHVAHFSAAVYFSDTSQVCLQVGFLYLHSNSLQTESEAHKLTKTP